MAGPVRGQAVDFPWDQQVLVFKLEGDERFKELYYSFVVSLVLQ